MDLVPLAALPRAARAALWRRRTSLVPLLRLVPLCRRLSGDDDDSTMDINSIVDQVLDGARAEINSRGLDQVDLPDITEKFKKKVGVFKITGKFEARGGWARSMSSLQRTGAATLSEHGEKVVVDVPLGLDDLELGYNYKAKLGKLGPGGRVRATVASNAVNLRASLVINGEACSLGVECLTLTELGEIKVHATGLGKLNFLYSQIVTWVTAKLHDKIEDAVERGLREAIDKAGLKVNCNSLFGL